MTNDPAVEPIEPTPAEPTPADPPAEPSEPLATAGDNDGPVGTPEPTWPDDWRELLAGNNEEALKTLKRFKDPSNVFKSYQSLRSRMDSGELRSAMPDASDEEAMAAWRVENGIPDTPDAYKEGLELDIPEEGMAMVDRYFADMHAAGATPEQARKGLESYMQVQEEMAEQRYEDDREFRAQAEDDLRSEWGPEFRANLNSMRNMITMYAPEGLQEVLFTSRQADGTLLGDNPDLLRFLVRMDGELNPHGTVTPAAGETPTQTIDREIAEIEALMKKDGGREYWRNEGKQARYRELLQMRDKFAA